MLSTTCKYALRAIIFIGINANTGNKVNVIQIATGLGAPVQFLSKILQVYVRKDILCSSRGPRGGFTFKRSPYAVTLFEIITIIDGAKLFENCVIGNRSCHCKDNREIKCLLHDNFSEIKEGFEEFFKTQTVGEIAESLEKQEKALLFL